MKAHALWLAKARRRPLVVAALALAVLAGGSGPTRAETPEPPPDSVTGYAMRWTSVDGGGGTAGGGGWSAASALGQPDAGGLAGPSWQLDGGFVVATPVAEPPLFTDDFETGGTGAWGSVLP